MNNNFKGICVLSAALATFSVLCARPAYSGAVGPRGAARISTPSKPTQRGSVPSHKSGAVGPRGAARVPMHSSPAPRGGGPAYYGGGHGDHHHRRHHHGDTGFAIGAGILGAGMLAETIYDATHPQPVVVEPAPVVQPVVVAPAQQVVVTQPQQVVVTQPQQVVATPPPAVPAGHYETRVENVWVEGRYVDQVTPQGTTVRVYQPGHYEQQSTQVWVTP